MEMTRIQEEYYEALDFFLPKKCRDRDLSLFLFGVVESVVPLLSNRPGLSEEVRDLVSGASSLYLSLWILHTY